MNMRPFVVGTRRSRLALYQAGVVLDLLRSARPDLSFELREYTASGDTMLHIPAPELAADAFTDVIERALADGEIDAAVHSYKDLPPDAAPGLIVAAVPVRADPREALVSASGSRLGDLPPGAVVGTSSERRAAAVLALRPDLVVKPIRGPVDARVQMVFEGEYDAAVLALAGLDRLGMGDKVSEIFDADLMPPPAGQGALAVQCRADDELALAILADIDDIPLHNAVDAELRLSRGATTS